MKKIFFNSLIISFLAIISCDKKLDDSNASVPTTNSSYKSSVYITNQIANAVVSKNDAGEAELIVRMASLSDRDETVTVALNDFISEYNKENSVEFVKLPQEEIEFYEKDRPANVSRNGQITLTIPKGKISSVLGVRVKALSEDKYPMGSKYAIPVQIKSSSLSQVITNKRALVTVQRRFITEVAHVKDGYSIKVKLDETIPATYEFTAQMHFMVDFFRNWGSDVNMTSIYGPFGYTRFQPKDVHITDAALLSGVGELKNEPKKWYQITFVYSKHETKIYLNGTLIRTYSTPNKKLQGGDVYSFFNAGRSFSAPHTVRELRIWSKALTESQINADLLTPVSPKSEGLVAYIPMNKEENGVKDVTSYDNKVTFYKGTGSISGTNQPTHEITAEEYQTNGIDMWYKNVEFPGGELK